MSAHSLLIQLISEHRHDIVSGVASYGSPTNDWKHQQMCDELIDALSGRPATLDDDAVQLARDLVREEVDAINGGSVFYGLEEHHNRGAVEALTVSAEHLATLAGAPA